MKSLFCLSVLALSCLKADDTGLVSWANAEKKKMAQDEAAPKTVHGSPDGKTAPHFQTDGFILTADFLYWQASEDNLDYADKVNGNLSQGPVSEGFFQQPLPLDFNWHPGFRVGLGGKLRNHDQWDLYFNYTYFYGTGSGSNTGGSTALFTSTWDPIFLNMVNNRALGHWSIHYNTWDGELGKDYFIGTHLTMRPFFGVRAAGILQRYHAKYDGLLNLNPPPGKFDAKGSFWGGGIRAGSNLLWHINRNWGICGELSGALLYGQCALNEKIDGNLPVNSFSNIIHVPGGIKQTVWRVRTTLQASIGIEWEAWFNHDKSRAALALNYEINEWFNLNPFFISGNTVLGGSGDAVPIFLSRRAEGDLGLQGMTFKAIFDF